MKKILVSLSLGILLAVPFTPRVQAMVVYDPSVEAQMITNVAHTAQQIQMQLQNLSAMDPATAAANRQLITSSLQQLINLQNNMSGLVMDYSDFQTAWGSQYHDFSDYKGMSSEQYAQNAQNLLTGLNRSLFDAMSAQGLVVQNADIAAQLQQLLNASQTAEGALAAAQVGNQLAALQAQQMMQFQTIMAESSRVQSEWMALQIHKEAMSKSFSAQVLGIEE